MLHIHRNSLTRIIVHLRLRKQAQQIRDRARRRKELESVYATGNGGDAPRDGDDGEAAAQQACAGEGCLGHADHRDILHLAQGRGAGIAERGDDDRAAQLRLALPKRVESKPLEDVAPLAPSIAPRKPAAAPKINCKLPCS